MRLIVFKNLLVLVDRKVMDAVDKRYPVCVELGKALKQ